MGRFLRLIPLVALLLLLPVANAYAAAQDVRIVTLNIRGALPDYKARDDIRHAKKFSDVLCLQESGAGRRHLLGSPGWNFYQPTGNGKGRNPILWRKRLGYRVHARSVKLSDRTYVGPRGAGPSTLEAKWLNILIINVRHSKHRLVVMNTHYVPSALYRNSTQKRRELYRQGIRRTTHYIDKYRNNGDVILCGDLNANYRKPPHPLFKPLDNKLHFSYEVLGKTAPTHPKTNSRFDYIGLEPRTPHLFFEHHRVLYGFHSDHRPLHARVRIN